MFEMRKNQCRSANLKSRRSGQVVVFVALGMTCLLGFGALAVDYGMLVSDRNRLQRACDAAALAGAQELKKTDNENTNTYNARQMAVTTAAQNGVTVNSGDITFLNSNKQIRVPASRVRNFFFARAIGRTSGLVTASATAAVSAGISSTTQYIAPVGITWETYNAYKNDTGTHDLLLVRQNKAVFDKDDFVLFDLRDPNGKSTAHMQDQLTGDERVPVSIGTFQTTLNAADNSQREKLRRGTEILQEQSEGPPWYDEGSGNGNGVNPNSAYAQILAGTMSRDNPRVIHIIVTTRTTIPNNGTYDTEIQAFVPVYVEEVDLGTKHGEDSATLTVRFLPPTTASDGQFDGDQNAVLGGVHVIGLMG